MAAIDVTGYVSQAVDKQLAGAIRLAKSRVREATRAYKATKKDLDSVRRHFSRERSADAKAYADVKREVQSEKITLKQNGFFTSVFNKNARRIRKAVKEILRSERAYQDHCSDIAGADKKQTAEVSAFYNDLVVKRQNAMHYAKHLLSGLEQSEQLLSARQK